jgi:hypothetical protein
MDETGLWNGSVLSRTYVDPATGDASVESPGDHLRDTGLVALSRKGQVFPWFFRHVPQKSVKRNGQQVIVRLAISGLNLELMQEWIEQFHLFIEDGPAVLLLDQLAVHKNINIRERLVGYNITVFLLPSQSGKWIAPCNNFFFASLKAELKKLDCRTSESKAIAFVHYCMTCQREKVINCWNHCGWVYPGQSTEE